MGKADRESGRNSRGKRKNKARMSYLKQRGRGGRGGGGGGGDGPAEGHNGGDGGGYLYNYDAVPYSQRGGWGRGGRGRGGRGRGGGGWYQHNQQNKRKPRIGLAAGMKGFIVSTNFRESDAVRESYNLLNEYDDPPQRTEEGKDAKGTEMETGTESSGSDVGPDSKMEVQLTPAEVVVSGDNGGGGDGPQPDGAKATETSEEGSKDGEEDKKVDSEQAGEDEAVSKDKVEAVGERDDDSDLDVDDALKKEIAELKSDRVRYRFNCVDTGVKNVIFINTTVDDPNELAYKIFEDAVSKKESKSRHIQRFVPITATCHADMNAIAKVCKEVFEKDLKDGYKSFKIIANVRNNEGISKTDIITSVANLVSQVNPLNFVDLNNPMFTITVEVLKTVFCLSVVKDFVRFKKFNLAEAGAPEPDPSEKLNEKPHEKPSENQKPKGKGRRDKKSKAEKKEGDENKEEPGKPEEKGQEADKKMDTSEENGEKDNEREEEESKQQETGKPGEKPVEKGQEGESKMDLDTSDAKDAETAAEIVSEISELSTTEKKSETADAI